MKTLNPVIKTGPRLTLWTFICVCFACSLVQNHGWGQSFNSGSNGSDGALNLIAPGTFEFDPVSLGLDLDGDNVYHFTSINIGAGVTVKLTARKINGPIYFLSQGSTTISGTIDLTGEDGHKYVTLPADRIPPVPGSGGYPGGVGGRASPNPAINSLGQPGGGPLGGPAATSSACSRGSDGGYGRSSASVLVVPLIGGSGGGGGNLWGELTSTPYGGGGGAGGGAVLIASSSTIALTGSIVANGGAAYQQEGCTGNGDGQGAGGVGAGGSIRLVANSISGGGSLKVIGGDRIIPRTGTHYPTGPYSDGFIRIEAFSNTFSGSIMGSVSYGTPVNTFLPSTKPPRLKVKTIGGILVPSSSTGSFTIPDVVLNTSSPVQFDIEASQIPLGTKVDLVVLSENGPDQKVVSTPLSGSVELSKASASVSIPTGYSRGYVRATWID